MNKRLRNLLKNKRPIRNLSNRIKRKIMENRREKNIRSYNADVYENPFTVNESLTKVAQRREYDRLRNEANRRIRELRRSGHGNTDVVKRYGREFLKPSNELTDRQVTAKLVLANRFIEMKTSTKSGIEAANKQRIETLQKHGYDIDRSQIDNFGEFMKKYRREHLDKMYSSQAAAEAFERANRAEISHEELMSRYEEFISAVEETYYERPRKGYQSSEEVRQILGL